MIHRTWIIFSFKKLSEFDSVNTLSVQFIDKCSLFLSRITLNMLLLTEIRKNKKQSGCVLMWCVLQLDSVYRMREIGNEAV